jgi:hypothetical protein
VVDDDGFVTILDGRQKGSALRNAVSCNGQTCAFPEHVTDGKPARVTWAWNGNGLIRARLEDDGALRLRQTSFGRRNLSASAAGLYSAIGHKLRGSYPITRIDGNDIYIDISEEAQVAR